SLRPPFQEDLVVLLNGRQPSQAGADDNPDPDGIVLGDLQARVIHGDASRRQGIMDEDIHLLYILRCEKVLGPKALYLGSDLGVEIRGIEPRYGADARNPLAYLRPDWIDADPERIDEADPRNNYPSAQAITSISILSPP